MPTRRQVVQAAAVSTALPVIKAQSFFSQAESAVLAEVTERIIPRTDTPGAIDAGVPAVIERAASRDRELGARLREGLARLASQGFAAADTSARIAMLKSIQDGPFFKTVKDLTIDAYYTSREGLTGELGWNANTFLPEFKGCTHPEHQS
jgi:hypothetical protein